MKYVTIPNADLRVAQICLGSAEFGATIVKDQAFKLLDAFIAEGGNFIDTAHVYSNWIPNTKSTSEKWIGEWLRKSGMRDDVIIATKGAHPELTSMNVSRLSKADIELDVHESLEYLQIDTIDLYWLHRDDVNIPVEEIIEALNEQVWLGNIRYFGCSNWTISRIKEALDYAARKGIHGFVANQPLWSLAAADMSKIPDQTLVGMDDAALAFHKRTKMAVIPYTSQAKGFFSKVERAGRNGLSEGDQKVYFSEINSRRLLRVQALAKKYAVSVNDIALSYLLSQSFVTIPVVGCKTIEQLKSSLKALDVVLSREELAELEAA
ncbi:MAG: aldo/keto reductase [Anaerolineaceae bacterium]|nr:aldo/keto reductase [Anaerolineaceae bacterium]